MRPGHWEFALILGLVLCLWAAAWWRFSSGRSEPLAGFNLQVWIAQGFGVGWIPVAPGTFGSVLGLLWFGALLGPGRLWIFIAGILAGIAVSVWLCGVAEKAIGEKDPGSVVLDEIVAMPVCFCAWVGLLVWKTGSLPQFDFFISARNWPLTLTVFALFRFFDIAKPWPARQSQALPGGWGITIDDVFAAGYVNALILLVNVVRR